MSFDFKTIRSDFPMLSKKMHGKPLVYLDSAATAQKPQKVIDTITDFYQNHYATVHRAIYELSLTATKLYDNARNTAQKFLNAKYPSEIIFTAGTTNGINLIANSFVKDFTSPGDEIIISSMEHHSNMVPWQVLCKEHSLKLNIIPINSDGEIILEEYERLLSPKTKLVAIAHISNATGTINPIEEITKLAHNYNAKVLIDGAQAAPHMKIDVQELNADFYLFSGHKTFGPTGIGILYGKKELLEQLSPNEFGGDMIEKVSIEKSTFTTAPLKFEAGTPKICQAIGLGSALEYMMKIGLENIYYYEKDLLKYLYTALQESEIIGLKIIGPKLNKRASLVSFNIENVHPLDVGTLLNLKGIAIRTGHHCAMPTMDYFNIDGSARASLAFYNTKEDIDKFILILKESVKILKP